MLCSFFHNHNCAVCVSQVWECVRATTAAPSYFVPLQFGDALYCDGALLANNPTAVALAEARMVFPGVPVEAVVSIGEQ
jgi:calcium-independent phospholipase A2-gamma